MTTVTDATVSDGARPRDVSMRVARDRNEVLVIQGRGVAAPGRLRLPFGGKPVHEFSFAFRHGIHLYVGDDGPCTGGRFSPRRAP